MIISDRVLEEDTYVGKIHEETADLMAHLAKETGTKISTMRDVSHVYDTIEVLEAHNLTLPSWANETVVKRMEDVHDIWFRVQVGNIELKRLYGGPLIQDILDVLTNMTTGAERR